MKTIKERSCPGLSGNNTLTYEIGMENDESFWLRLVKSSGGGFLCKDWVAMATVIDTLRQAPVPFTSYELHKLFAGKSVNTLGFVMAVLKHEGLVTPAPDKQQAFVIDDLDVALEKFRSRISKGASASSPKKKKAAPRKQKRK